jgi:Flavodoxin
MRAVLVYESMYGNTHLVADAIGNGLREAADDVVVVPVTAASIELLQDADLVIVGGPTHVHGMSRARTRGAAVEAAQKPDSDLVLDADAQGLGLRDWFGSLGGITTNAAAFDTRIDAPAALTGRASKGIARKLRQNGFTLVADPKSFLVTKTNRLEDGEAAQACDWGAQLAANLRSSTEPRSPNPSR